MQRAGGDPDARTVRFPRQGESGGARDTVVLQGPEKLVESVKAELEKVVADLQDRVCLGVHVPRAGHAQVIGRGAAGIKELQKAHNVTIAVPGWREWTTAGAPLNAEDLAGVDDGDIIKIIGSASACDAAAKDVLVRRRLSAAWCWPMAEH